MTPNDIGKATACANLRFELDRLHMLENAMTTTLGELRDCQQKISLLCARLQEIETLEEAEPCHG